MTLIIVTGYFGAPIEETARELAERKGFAFLSLDREIEQRDGRSIRRLSMMNGEHGYRNQEYEILNEISSDLNGFLSAKGDPDRGGLVVACGDGVLYDEMSRDIALANTLVIIGEDMDTDSLWDRAKAIDNTCHAFLFFGSDEEKRQAFEQYIQRQRVLFEDVRSHMK